MEVETLPKEQPLDKSASTISSFIQRDDSYPDLSNQLSHNGHSGSSAVLDYKQGTFFRRDSTPIVLPQALQDCLGYAQYKAYTGFFAELNRAYLTVDSKFFLWDYNEKNSYISYDELEDIIVSVAIVAPKPDIFVDTVKHVLVIATTVEIILVALVNEDGRYSLSSTNYHIPSDNVNMQCIVGTDNGRIFLCGMDGCLYEVVYELQDSWFRKKIQKINRSSSSFAAVLPFLKYQTNEPLLSAVNDNTRNLLYTLSASSSVQVFYLGEKCDGLSFLVELSQIPKKAKAMLNSGAISQDEGFDIKNIFVVDKNESSEICLVAISKAGIRYYFALETSFSGVPRNVSLVHVRLPPNMNQYLNGSRMITQAYYFKGISFLAEHKNNEIVDSFTIISPHSSPKQLTLLEYQFNSKLQEGFVGEIVEIPEKVLSDSSLLTWPERSRLERNKLALQHVKNPRHFLLYTGRVIETYYEIRPLDMLQDLLTAGSQSQALTEFKDTYGGDEFCCMCLILASYGISKPVQQGKIAQNAIMAFSYYAGTASFDLAQNITFSSAHNGLALLLARILRPIFNSPLIKKEVNANNEEVYSMAWDINQLMELKNELASLKTVLEHNPSIAPKESITKSLELPSKVERFTKLMDKSSMARNEEERQRASLHILLDRAIEGIAFLFMIANQNLDMSVIMNNLNEVVRNELKHIVFSRFLISPEGNQIHKDLVDAILAHYAQTGPDKRNLMSEFLSKNCPSWFSEVDRVKTSGFELLYTAINYPKSKETERRSYLEASLEQFENITEGIIEKNFLGEICNLYSLPTVKFYKGVIQLCLSCAKTVDPAHIISRSLPSMRMEDLDQDLKNQKEACYEPIKKILISLIQQCVHERQEDSPLQDLLECFKLCKKSDDPLFHYFFYQLQIDQSMTKDLLSVDTDYLESFLKKYCKPINYGHELLARYYSSRGRFFDAAKLQIGLATQTESPFSLEPRVVFLHQALASARKAQSTISVSSLESARKDDAEKLVDEIESLLEVAQVQIAMASELDNFPNVVARNSAKAKISERLFSTQELFENFAVPFQLFESTLSLYKIAMVNPEEVENIWSNIFNRIVTTQPRSALIPALQQKVISLGREHWPNDLVFPIPFLVKLLERCNRTIFNNSVLNQSVFWVCESMLEIGVPHHVLIRLYWDLCNELEKSETVIIVAVLCKLLLDYQHSLNSKELINYTSLRADRIIDGISTILATYPPKERSLSLTKGCEEKLKLIKEGNEKIHPFYRSSTRFI